MGVDFFDIGFRVEKKFGIKLRTADFQRFVENGKWDFTAGELHELIVEKCKELELPIPRSSWRHLQIILSKSLDVSPWEVRREALLIKDLGMS